MTDSISMKAHHFPVFDETGSDEDFPAQCFTCKKPAKRTDQLSPSSDGFMVKCSEGHLNVAIPDFDHPVYRIRHPEYFAMKEGA